MAVTPEDTTRSPWVELVAAAALVSQQALDRLEIPALLIDSDTRRVLAANRAIGQLFAVPVEAIVGRPADEVVDFEDEEGMKRAVAALRSGAIDGYRARRRITSADGVVHDVYAWARAVDLDGGHLAVYLVSPVEARPDPPGAWAGPLVVGKADGGLRIKCISSDAKDVFGWDPAALIDQSVLTVTSPEDADDLVRAVSNTPVEGTVARRLTMRHRDGAWVPVSCIFVRMNDERPPAIAFALLPAAQPPPEAAADRVADMEHRLRRIAAELHAAGVMDEIVPLPPSERFPQLNTLSTRQWQVLVRLLRGERVPSIAAELFLSQGTVRNHLAAIFERFDVHSQAELIALLRSR